MAVIDADTHVIESEEIWHFFDGPESKRPYLVQTRDADGTQRTRWVVDGILFPKSEGRGAQFAATPPIIDGKVQESGELLWAWRSLAAPKDRAVDASARGVDHQVVYPTMFLNHVTREPAVEVGLCRSYNRFMADRWREAGGSFSWVIVPPLQTIDAAIAEIAFGKDNGAVGIFFRGMESDRSIADPYFEPIYREALERELPICVHTGPGSPTIAGMMDSRNTRTFGSNRVLPIIAFNDLITREVPKQFPGLRFGFLESSASWVPFMLHFLKRAGARFKTGPSSFGPEFFDEYNIFVACEADEDIPYLASHIGWSHLLAGTDYGHADQSSELDLVGKIKGRSDVPSEQAKKILETNPAIFYGLST